MYNANYPANGTPSGRERSHCAGSSPILLNINTAASNWLYLILNISVSQIFYEKQRYTYICTLLLFWCKQTSLPVYQEVSRAFHMLPCYLANIVPMLACALQKYNVTSTLRDAHVMSIYMTLYDRPFYIQVYFIEHYDVRSHQSSLIIFC